MATSKSNEQPVFDDHTLRLIIGTLALAFRRINICTASSLE
jgi:hypothetical protein